MSEPVMRRLIDYMLLPASKADPKQQVLAMDILLRAVEYCSNGMRRQLSQRISRLQPRVPCLAGRLARDSEITVASPLLLDGAMLSDRDLATIAKSGDAERCKLIASRRDVSPAVSAAIVAAGHMSAIRQVLENKTSRISSDTMEALMALAPDSSELHKPLLYRPEMNARYALGMFWYLGPHLRQDVLSRFLSDCHVLRGLLEPDTSAQRGSVRSKPLAAVSTQDSPYTRTLRLLIGNIEDGKVALAAKKLANLLSVPVKLAQKLIEDKSGEPVAVAFKASGITRAQFADCVLRWTKSKKAPLSADRDRDGLESVFERLSRDQARIAVTYWLWQHQDA